VALRGIAQDCWLTRYALRDAPLAMASSASRCPEAIRAIQNRIRRVKQELAMVDGPSILTVAGLFIMSHVEANRGRMHDAWNYCGRSARMALDLIYTFEATKIVSLIWRR
jgi:hypothetical protein